jgi:hypothetical protein
MLLAFDVAVLHRIYQKEMLNVSYSVLLLLLALQLYYLHIENDAASNVVCSECLVYAQTVVYKQMLVLQ